MDAALTLPISAPAAIAPAVSASSGELTEWVQQAQQGNATAFDELVRRTQGLVRKTAFPLLRADQIDDAVQESYLVVYQKLHHLRDASAFQAWLVRIVLHVCYAIIRKTPLVAQIDEKASVTDETRRVADKLDLKAALARLKEEDRSILILREMLGMSYEEVAYALRLPIGTVRSRLHYGRKKLAELLDRPG